MTAYEPPFKFMMAYEWWKMAMMAYEWSNIRYMKHMGYRMSGCFLTCCNDVNQTPWQQLDVRDSGIFFAGPLATYNWSREATMSWQSLKQNLISHLLQVITKNSSDNMISAMSISTHGRKGASHLQKWWNTFPSFLRFAIIQSFLIYILNENKHLLQRKMPKATKTAQPQLHCSLRNLHPIASKYGNIFDQLECPYKYKIMFTYMFTRYKFSHCTVSTTTPKGIPERNSKSLPFPYNLQMP